MNETSLKWFPERYLDNCNCESLLQDISLIIINVNSTHSAYARCFSPLKTYWHSKSPLKCTCIYIEHTAQTLYLWDKRKPNETINQKIIIKMHVVKPFALSLFGCWIPTELKWKYHEYEGKNEARWAILSPYYLSYTLGPKIVRKEWALCHSLPVFNLAKGCWVRWEDNKSQYKRL